ncbi:flagellar biosynthetic protein FliR [Sporichthya brevicatena]|uniref:Flagellar biosynthetic protein FliR n=1 Tax=Sporichthya brevicatena TaxID=171442 RepID=A0ABN1GDV6_9ACTN
MALEFAMPTLLGLLLGSVRSAAWLLVSPPFATRTIPGTVKAMLAVALALPVASQIGPAIPELSTGGLISAIVLQVVTGAALGFVTYLLFAAIQAAGDLIDLFGGFTLASAYDPMSMSQSSIFGRFHQLLGLTLLFVTDAHLLIVSGFLRSYDAIPVTEGVALDATADAVLKGVTQFFLAALEIAGPMIIVLFLADVALGLLTRVSPQLNAFTLGFPLKIFLTLALIGFTFPLLPGAIDGLSDAATDATLSLFGGESG